MLTGSAPRLTQSVSQLRRLRPSPLAAAAALPPPPAARRRRRYRAAAAACAATAAAAQHGGSRAGCRAGWSETVTSRTVESRPDACCHREETQGGRPGTSAVQTVRIDGLRTCLLGRTGSTVVKVIRGGARGLPGAWGGAGGRQSAISCWPLGISTRCVFMMMCYSM